MQTYWGNNGTRTRVIENILKPDGNRISAQVDYEYDDLYRLVHEHRIAYNGGDPGVAYEYNFAYDAAGNRTSWQTVGGSTISYTYDAANKMLTAGNSTFTYDDAGNMLTETNGSIVTTYTWDYLNRLTQWQKTGHTTQSYVYNADGIRVRITPSGGTATHYLLDGREIAEGITGANVISYVGPGVACEILGNTRIVYHADGIGSTRAMSDCNNPVVIAEAGIYDAYGNIAAMYGNTPEFGYAGRYRYHADATGLDYLKMRYYDSSAGRFISRDPIGYRGGLNLYVYVGNNPITRVDPNGQSYWGDIGNGMLDPGNWGYAKPGESYYACVKRCMCTQVNGPVIGIIGAIGGIGGYIGGPIYGGNGTLGPVVGVPIRDIIAIGTGPELIYIGGVTVVAGTGAWTIGSGIGCAAACSNALTGGIGDAIGDWLGRHRIVW